MGLVNVRAGNLTFRFQLFPLYSITYDSRHSTFDLEYIHLHKNTKTASLQTLDGYILEYSRDKEGGEDNARGQRYLRVKDGPEPYGDLWVKDGTITIDMRTGGIRTYTEDRKRKETGTDKYFILSGVDGRGNNQWIMTFDEEGNLASIIPTVGAVLEFSYPEDRTMVIGLQEEPPSHRLTFTEEGDVASWTTTRSIPSVHGSEPVTNTPVETTYTFQYESDGRLSAITDSFGRTRLTVAYGPDGRVTRMTRPGELWTYTYGPDTCTVQFSSGTTRAFTGEMTVTYQDVPTGTRETITDCSGAETINLYSTEGDLLCTTDANGHTWTFTHHAILHTVTSMTSPLGHRREYGYNPDGTLLFQRDPLGHETTYFYDEAGSVIRTTDAMGNVATFTYDDHHQMNARTNALGYTTTIATTYDGSRLASRVVTDPEGYPTTYQYDYDFFTGQEILTDTYRSNGGHWSYTYANTENGVQRKEVIDPFGTVTSGNYNPAPCGETHLLDYAYRRDARCDDCPEANQHRFWKGKDPDTGVTLHTRDQEGYETDYEYEAIWGRRYLSSVTRYDIPNGRWTDLPCGLTVPQWDRTGLDPSGATTAYAHDCMGRLLAETDPMGKVTSYAYDGVGNRISKTFPNGKTVIYTYDADNRLTGIDYPDGRSESYEYDPAGRVTAAHGLDAELYYEYDALGRVTTAIQEVEGEIETLQYGYDALGHRTILSASPGMWTYSYDRNGRTASITNPDGDSTSFTYASCCGALAVLNHANGTSIEYSYDLAERTVGVINRSAAGEIITSFAYERDPNGLILSIDREDPLWDQAYSYDPRLQLREVVYGNGDSEAYVYDSRGNRIEKWEGEDLKELLVYSPADEILHRVRYAGLGLLEFEEDYTYTQVTGPIYELPAGPGTWYRVEKTYSNYLAQFSNHMVERRYFDFRERLHAETRKVDIAPGRYGTQMIYPSYLPDGMGRVGKSSRTHSEWLRPGPDGIERILFTEASVHRMVNDFEDVLTERVETSSFFDGQFYQGPDISRQMTHGPGIDNPLSFKRVVEPEEGTMSEDVYTFGMDARRNVSFLSNASGTLAEGYEYDPWGNLRAGSPDLNPVLFQSREYDTDLGLYFNRARYYDPGIGRFINSDLIYPRTYRYGRNNPTLYSDPMGLFDCVTETELGSYSPGGPQGCDQMVHDTLSDVCYEDEQMACFHACNKCCADQAVIGALTDVVVLGTGGHVVLGLAGLVNSLFVTALSASQIYPCEDACRTAFLGEKGCLPGSRPSGGSSDSFEDEDYLW